MKTSIITLAAVLTFTATLALAGNESIRLAPANGETSSLGIAPVTPVEADFEEMIPVNDFRGLAPVAPAEATFEEIPADNMLFAGLAPTTPVTAGFEDEMLPPAVDFSTLAPVTPVEADFE